MTTGVASDAVHEMQKLRRAAERDSGEHNHLLAVDAADDLPGNPARSDFILCVPSPWPGNDSRLEFTVFVWTTCSLVYACNDRQLTPFEWHLALQLDFLRSSSRILLWYSMLSRESYTALL